MSRFRTASSRAGPFFTSSWRSRSWARRAPRNEWWPSASIAFSRGGSATKPTAFGEYAELERLCREDDSVFGRVLLCVAVHRRHSYLEVNSAAGDVASLAQVE
jgi:hypothetical protein